ncbi:MAG: 3-dehydroquinate synthase [Gemmatimonadales bacterium]
MTARTVAVPLPHGAYGVVVGSGLLAQAGDRIRRACPAARYALIADQTVADLYAARLAVQLDATIHTFPAGEAQKTRTTWTQLTDALLASGLGRDGALVALGGGVPGDVAGFVAATYLRGIPYVQVPTTLLAMVDSSVGGKTGVDAAQGKNLIGAFHQPRLVLADVHTIATLPPAHRRAGLVEALKHGAVADAGYFDRLVAARDALLAADPEALIEAVVRSVAIKAEVVTADATERGRRAVLNAGHTVGHALETASDYTLAHGEAVAIGLVVEARIGEQLGVTARGTAGRLRDAFQRCGLPVSPPTIDRNRLREALAADKKNRGGEIRLTLLASIGAVHQTNTETWTTPVPENMVVEAVQAS